MNTDFKWIFHASLFYFVMDYTKNLTIDFFVYVVLLCLGIEHATSTPQQDLYRMNRVEKVPKHATVTQHWPHFMLECAIFSRKKFFRKLIHYNQALAMHHQPNPAYQKRKMLIYLPPNFRYSKENGNCCLSSFYQLFIFTKSLEH